MEVIIYNMEKNWRKKMENEIEIKPEYCSRSGDFQVCSWWINGHFIAEERTKFYPLKDADVWYSFPWNLREEEAKEIVKLFDGVTMNPSAYYDNFYWLEIKNDSDLAEKVSLYLYKENYDGQESI